MIIKIKGVVIFMLIISENNMIKSRYRLKCIGFRKSLKISFWGFQGLKRWDLHHLMFFKYQKYFWHNSNILAWYLLTQYYFVLYSVAKLTIHIFRYPIYVPICISACSILHLSFSLSFYLLYFLSSYVHKYIWIQK